MSTVLLDCDGVLSNFVDGILDELRLLGLRDVPETFTEYNLAKQLSPTQWAIAKDVMTDGNFWRNLPVCEGALNAVCALKREQHDIYVVTSPWLNCYDWEHSRREWLWKNLGLRQNRVITTTDKRMITGDIFVDDCAKHVMTWQSLNPAKRALLMDRPWNKKDPSMLVRQTWNKEDIEDLLEMARV